MRLNASIVGSSWNAAEISGVAPMRSPADTNSVFGLVARRSRTVVARYSTPPALPSGSAPPIRPPEPSGGRRLPWKSLSARICSFRSVGLACLPALASTRAPAMGARAIAVAITPSANSAFLIFTLPLPLLQLPGELDQLRRLSSGHGLTGLPLDLVHVRGEDALFRLRLASRCRSLRVRELVTQRLLHLRAVDEELRQDAEAAERHREVEPDDDPVVIRHAELVGLVQRHELARALEVVVVVEHRRLVGVDVPLRDAGHAGQDRRVPECVVEVAPLSVEHVGVRVRADAGSDQVRERLGLERRDRTFLRVRIEVADDEDVLRPGTGGIAVQPVGEQVCGVCAHPGAVALAVARVWRVANTALALEVVRADDDTTASVQVDERLRNGRPVPRSPVAAVDERDGVQRCGLADRRDLGGLVQQPNLDRVGAESVHLSRPCIGVDERVRPGRRRLVQAVDEELDRAGRTVAVVLDLADADYVAARADDRSDGLRPLAGELTRVVGATALGHRPADTEGAAGGAKRVEEVEEVHPHDLQRAADGR